MNITTRSAKIFAAGFIGGALTVGSLIGMATAHADENQDFLNCLSNHGVVINEGHQNDVLGLMSLAQTDLRNGISANTVVTNLVVYYDIPFSIAEVDVQCVTAVTLLGN